MPTILLELAGLICLVVAGAFIHPALAFAVAGLGLLGKSFEVEGAVRRRKAQGRRLP